MYWQVLQSNVRMLGSMHLIPADNAGLPGWALQAFEWAEVLVFESHPKAIFPHFPAPHPQPLQQEMKPAAWEALGALWPKAGPLPAMEAVRPWAALLIASVLTQKTAVGIEPQFLQWAAEQSKPVKFLESGEDLAAALDSSPTAEICDALELLAADLGEPQRSLEGMYTAWLRGDMPALFEVARQSPMYRLAGLREAFLERRNRAWAPHLRELMNTQQRTLVCVGALHLHGAESAIECAGLPTQLIPAGG